MAALTAEEVTAIRTYLATINSKRARVLEAVRMLTETITTERGYTQSVKEVSYNVKGWRDKTTPQTPVIYIVDDRTQITKHAGLVREYAWTLRLFGVCRELTLPDFERFLSDVEQCIYDNNCLFGECNKMEVDEITTDNQLFSGLDGTHLFEVSVTVEYTRSARNGR